MTNGSNEFPGLAAFDGDGVIVCRRAEEDKVVDVIPNIWKCNQVFFQCLSYAGVDHHFVAFPSLALLDPESSLDSPLLIQKVIDLQLQQIRDAQCGVDSHHEQQQITKTLLSSQ